MRIAVTCTILFALLLPLSGVGQQGEQRTNQQSQPTTDQQQTTDQQSQLPTFRKNVNLVNVYFTVKDHHGVLVPNLTKDDFELAEDGKPQTIKYFAAETNLPLTLGLLIDSSASMQKMLPEEQVVGADFLRQVITDKDLAFIISFDISVDLLQDLTSDVHLLSTGLQRARINTGGGSGGIPGLGQGPVPISRPKGTLLYDGVYLASSEVLSKQVGRKAMVVLTDGNDEGSQVKLREAIEYAQKADAICYVLLLHDPQYGPPGAGEMRQLTEATGGRVIEVNNPNKIGDAFHQISAELRSQYSLGYTPDNDKRDGSFRKIEIKAKSKDNFKVQARKGYYAPSS
jgi:VWFA-related protein